MTICGVETMLVPASPRSALMSAAQPPDPVIWPTPSVMPSAIAERFGGSLRGRRGEPEDAAAARVGEVREADELVVRAQPRDAERRGLLLAELDDDRVDLHL